jgi:quinol---cytochrome c reductase iron-sulfur subunit, bacillus type
MAETSPTETGPELQPRRRFLALLFGLLSTAIVAVLAIPLGVLGIAPVLKRPKRQWLELGDISQIEIGKPTRFSYRYHHFDGYLDYFVRGTAYVVTRDRQQFTVFNNVCTHAGCGVRWEEGKKGFYCPCHNGLFDINGKVVSGPPPRPLDRFAYKVDGGKILIEIKEA